MTTLIQNLLANSNAFVAYSSDQPPHYNSHLPRRFRTKRAGNIIGYSCYPCGESYIGHQLREAPHVFLLIDSVPQAFQTCDTFSVERRQLVDNRSK